MKALVLILAGACGVVAGSAIYLAQHKSPPTPADTPGLEITDAPQAGEPVPTPAQTATAQPAPVRNVSTRRPAPVPSAAVTAPSTDAAPSLLYQQALGTLVSAQAGYGQKQAAWKQLKDAGQLDQTIADLEQMARSNPSAAEYPAALGQACLQKAGTLTDIREQGILGLKADQSLDAALNLDPSNWEAGFWKAAAMSYWPPQLGKGKEVIERFVALIELQESQPPQSQFAQTYLLLGEQYQKQGYADYATKIWQRGAALFPNNPAFAEKLNPPAAESSTVR